MTRSLAALILSLSVAACTSSQTEDVPPRLADNLPAPIAVPGAAPGASNGQCNAQAAQFLLGELANVAATDQAEAATGAETVRVLYPNQPVTQEFVPTRLNLETDQQNRIVNIRCG